MLIKKESSLIVAAAKSGMDEETARKYRNLGKLPSQVKKPHNWRTRQDPFEKVWPEALSFLWNPGIEAKTVFIYLQRKYPGKFQDGQLRTFQRKVKVWKAVEGPPKEVYFQQKHYRVELHKKGRSVIAISINIDQTMLLAIYYFQNFRWFLKKFPGKHFLCYRPITKSIQEIL